MFVGTIHPGAWTRPIPDRDRWLGATRRRVRTSLPGSVTTAGRGARSGERDWRLRRGEAPLAVVLEDALELRHEAVAPERPVQLAVDEDRRDRLLERARQRDPDVGVLRLAGAVHDAAHDRHPHVLDPGAGLLPLRHPVLEIGLDLLGHLLEERRRRPAAAGAGAD